MYPLMTNDRSLSPAQVLEAHKGQPMIEKRFEQVKTVHEIAPVFLKNEGRIEALFTLYFLALLVQALIERELRLAMTRENIDELPLYPEQRQCAHPTTEQVLRLFSLAERHKLLQDGQTIQVFDLSLTDLQRQVLARTRRLHPSTKLLDRRPSSLEIARKCVCRPAESKSSGCRDARCTEISTEWRGKGSSSGPVRLAISLPP